MKGNRFTRDDGGQLDRRSLLKLTAAAAGSTVAGSSLVAANGGGNGNGNGGNGNGNGSGNGGNGGGNGNGNGSGGGKSGGRGQTSHDVHLDEPFTVSNPRAIQTNASCMSDRSAEQDYNRYDFEYCDPDLGGGTLCVKPEQSPLNEDRVYEFRSKQECKAPGSEFQHRFSFGPSNSDHDC